MTSTSGVPRSSSSALRWKEINGAKEASVYNKKRAVYGVKVRQSRMRGPSFYVVRVDPMAWAHSYVIIGCMYVCIISLVSRDEAQWDIVSGPSDQLFLLDDRLGWDSELDRVLA